MDDRKIITAVERQAWLAPVADALHQLVHGAYGALGPARRPVKDFFNGTWLGHPLHPLLTDVTVGMWMAGALFDTIEGLTRSRRAGDCADVAITAGTISSVATATAGASDWMYLSDGRRIFGTAHALSNVLSLAIYATSLALRRAGRRTAGRAAGFLAFGVAGLAAFLGAKMAYVLKVGVNHLVDAPLPEDYVPVLAYADLPEGRPVGVEAEGVPVVLVRQGSRISALVDRCSHLGGALHRGRVEGDSIICPLHGSRYSLEDGRVLNGPSAYWEPVLDVRLHNGQIEVRGRQGGRTQVQQ